VATIFGSNMFGGSVIDGHTSAAPANELLYRTRGTGCTA